MMIIDMTPQLAFLATAMNGFLAVAAVALSFSVLRQHLARRAGAARRQMRLEAARA